MKRRRSGFAMILAVALLGMIAMTLTAIGITCSMQAMRTRTLAQEAQLRQLLLAGAQAAHARLQASAAVDGPVKLPDDLSQVGDKLILIARPSADSDQAIIEIRAALDQHGSSQTVHFSRQNGAWQINSAGLGI
jgi:hypothetical protein